MKVEFTNSFIKTYKKRILPNDKLHQKFKIRTELFSNNPKHTLLKNHRLTGNLEGYWAFSITGDVRVVYKIKNEVAYFTDIGTHNQVY